MSSNYSKLQKIIQEELNKELNEQGRAFERFKSMFRDSYGSLSKASKTLWKGLSKKNKIKALKKAASELAPAANVATGALIDVAETLITFGADEIAVTLEKVLRSPIVAASELGITKQRKENAFACVWANYRVGTGVNFGGKQLRIPFGHAGVCLVSPKGVVRWWNIGGSGSSGAEFVGTPGRVVGRAKYNSDGTIKNIENLLKRVKKIFPASGSLEAVIIRNVDYKEAVKAANKPPKTYSVIARMKGENCATYVVRVLSAGGGSSLTANVRSQLIVTPRKLIPLLQNDFDERTISV